ncbi:MAG: L,D-transpeptidase family protein [Oscillospiraceae bacterium]|nr:L,D-transpeptidase family protein [Oscillospiraceae bacterium]
MKNKHKRLLAILLSLCLAASTVTTTIAVAAQPESPTESAGAATESTASSEETTSSGAGSTPTDTTSSAPTESEPAPPTDPSDDTLPTFDTAGWHTVDNKKYYSNESGKAVTGWQTINGKTYFFGPDGVMATMWKTISGKKYYFGNSGEMRTGWRTIDGKKYYFGNSGEMRTGWRTINGKKYYFGNSGEMRTGWRTINGKKYYFGNSGEMRTGWRTIDGKKYYFQSNGAQFRKKGFQTIEQKRYYVNSDYSIQQGWKTISGKTYYFGNSGEMRTGWRTINNKVYYFNNSGVMQKNVWKRFQGNRYYLQSNGAAATGWTKIGAYRYYFSSKGVLDEDVRDRSDVKGPYELVVSLKECTITVIARGTDGVANIAAAKFVCSPGKASTPTPTGVFTAQKSARWQILMGPSWGQYGLNVYMGIYFHSIPCGQANVFNVPSYDYYTLGTPASHGCIRLLVRDEKWIYDHAGNGIKTTITDTTNQSVISYLSKPTVPALQSRNGLTWDPTDPIASKQMGTAIPKVTYEKPSYEQPDDPTSASGEALLKYRATDTVNYRDAAGLSGNIKGALYDGQVVYVVDKSSKKADGYTWYKIKIGSKYYYVAASFLTKA